MFVVIAAISILIALRSSPTDISAEDKHLKSTQFASNDLASWIWSNKTKCGSVSYDLPYLNSPFIGRKKEMARMIYLMNTAHIVSINGAPGFGKSLLAMNVGYEMIRHGTTVRYIDAMDKLSHLRVFTESDERVMNPKPTKSYRDETKYGQTSAPKSLLKRRRGSYSIAKDDNSFQAKLPSDKVLDSLLRWSRDIDCHTLLILDNCDDIIQSATQRERFIYLLKAMVENSKENLHIILTSRQQILILDDYESLVIKELSDSASIELLSQLAPKLSQNHSELVASLVEGCPLALKVVGRLLHKQEDTLTKKLEDELLNQPISVLDRASIQKERFSSIMDVVYEQLSEEMQECGYYLSFFPGTFEHQAGSAILPSSLTSQKCFEYYAEQSLLDKFIVAHLTHYKMHRLIREYFKQRGNISTRSVYYYRDFEKNYCRYFTNYLLNHAKRVKINNISEEAQYHYSSEIHNIYHLLNLLLSKTEPHLTKELTVLAYAVGEDFISANLIKDFFYLLVAKVNETCYYIQTEKCSELFSLIITQLYNECKCNNIKEFFLHVFSTPCMNLFQCETVAEIEDHPGISSRLGQSERNFLFRLKIHHCEATIMNTCAFYIPFFEYCVPKIVVQVIIYFYFFVTIIGAGFNTDVIDPDNMVFFHVFLLLRSLYDAIFNYELIIWMIVMLPDFIIHLWRLYISIQLSLIFETDPDLQRHFPEDLSLKDMIVCVTISTIFCAFFELFICWRFIPYCC
jgi:archaellum biogenesis ATPase FlaH